MAAAIVTERARCIGPDDDEVLQKDCCTVIDSDYANVWE